MWLFYALLCAVSSGSLAIFHRFVMRESDFISYGFLQQGISTIIYFLIMVSSFQFSFSTSALEFLVLGMIFWSIATVVNFKGYKHTDASVRTPVYTIRLIFVAVLSFIVLSEPFPVTKIVGTGLILFGIMFLNFRKKIFSLKDIGIKFVLLAALLTSIALTVDKIALNFFSPMVYGFFIYFADTTAFGMLSFKRMHHLKSIVRSKMKIVVAAAVLDVLSYFGLLWALKLQQASVVFPIAQMGGLIAVIGGIIILKERQNISQKIFGVSVAILGAAMVAGYLAI